MIDCGVDGFRLDALKHIMLPSEGSDFLNIFKKDANILHNRENLTIYGELIHINDMNLLEQYIQCGIKPMINLSDTAYRFRDEGKTDQIYTFFESADSFLNKDDFGGWVVGIGEDYTLTIASIHQLQHLLFGLGINHEMKV